MEEEKKGLAEFIEKHPKVIFWIRFVLWAACACVLPIVFIGWRFELFNTASKFSLGGWGIIGIIIAVVFVVVLASYVKQGMTSKNVMIAQCVTGFVKVIIPLLALLGVLYALRNSIDRIMQALGCVILCEVIALPINPMPKWVLDQQKDVEESKQKSTIDYFVNRFFTRKKEDE